jgi:CHAT domain-containing protein/Tfp pilus assembly protein PilF
LDAAVMDATARIHAFTGNHREQYRLDSIAVARRRARGGEPRALLARELHSLGLALYQLGRASEAIPLMEEGLTHAEAIGSDDGIARALVGMALTYQTNGYPERAGELLHRALEIGERARPPQLARMAVGYNNLGHAYLEAGNPEAARPYAERALEISRSTGQPYAGVLARLNLVSVAFAAGDTARAEELLRTSLALSDSLGYQGLKGYSMLHLGLIAASRGDAAEARRLLASAVSVAESTAFLAGQYEALEGRGRALDMLQDTAGAIAAYGATVELLESWRGRVALGDLQIGIAARRLEPYEALVRFAIARGRHEEAFGFAERARARVLLGLMARREANPRPYSAEERWRERIRDLEADTARLAALADTLAAHEAGARRRDPATGAARYPVPVSLAEARAVLAAPGRGLLVYFWGDRDVFGWWVARDTVRAARLGSSDSLTSLVTFLQRVLQSPGSEADWAPVARRAFDLLVAPLTAADVGELLVVPDGPLAQVPMEALVDGAHGPLGTGRRVVYGPSTSVLVALERAAPRKRWDRAMLAVGDPRLREVAVADPFRDPSAGPPGPLPHAAKEARAVGELFRPSGSDLLLHRDATLQRWLASDPGRYRFLHFAAHALVDIRRPERTHVLLSGGDLDLVAIQRLRLSAELVTLSACETGLGRRFRGEGVIGLPHAFLAAGARGAVVTLWRVEDRYAAEFMEEFYQAVAGGAAPAAALQSVRRRWAADPGPRSHPARWAAFVLVGGLQHS